MSGIFPSVPEIEAELSALRAEREALDAAIAERQLFIELGRRLADRRRGGGTTPAPRPEPVDGAAGHDSLEAAAKPAAGRPEVIGAVPPTLAKPQSPMVVQGERTVPAAALTPRTAARAHGRELVAEAVAILREHDRPMHAAELVPLLAARGYTLPGHDPVAALNTRLWKRARTGRHVVRHGDAVYAAGEDHADDLR